MPSRRLALLTLAASTVLASCGGPAALEVQVTAPKSPMTTHDPRITVSGTVSPDEATVRVAGRKVQVQDGAFSTVVPLEIYQNNILVEATSDGSEPFRKELIIHRKRTAAEQAEKDAEDRENERINAELEAEDEAAERRDNYPADVRQAFISACTVDGTDSACECALEEIEKQLTLQQYLQVDYVASNSGYIPERLRTIFAGCS